MKLHYVDFVDFPMQREKGKGEKWRKNGREQEAEMAASGSKSAPRCGNIGPGQQLLCIF